MAPPCTESQSIPKQLESNAKIVGIGLESPPERGGTALRFGEEVWIRWDAAIDLNDQSARMSEAEGLAQPIAAVPASAGGTPTGHLRDLLSSVSGEKQFADDLSLMRLTFDPAQSYRERYSQRNPIHSLIGK